jgi:HK97 gp10 family phage protein
MASIFEGMDDLERKFESLGAVAQRAVLGKAIRAAGAIVRDEAERRAPRDTGDLAENMTMRIKDADISSVSIDVGPGKDQFYGFFHEFGTAHQAARPFLSPAFEDKKVEAQQAMIDKVTEEITKRMAA